MSMSASTTLRKRVLCILTAVSLSLSMLVTGVLAKEDKTAGEAPVYNSAKQVYEISKPAHLMYLSGTWKDGAPRDGHYVLTSDIDMKGVTGFKPIASKKDEGFTGIFDGQFHAIRNLRVEYDKKYAGFFGYVGNENEQAYVRNLALLDIYVSGQQNVGGISGVSYGTTTNCVVTGKIEVLDLSNSHTAGGITGKLKEGEGPIIGHIEDCYVDAEIRAPYDAGGIAGIQDGGGYLARCYAAGSVEAYGENGAVGGIDGSFNAGDHLENCVAVQTVLKGTKNVDKIVGQLDDEAAVNIQGNLAWEGTALLGNEPSFQPIRWDDVSTAKLQDQATYQALGWDFNKNWTWNADTKQPILKGFDKSIFPAPALTDTGTQIISRAVNTAKLNAKTEISARVVSAAKVASATLYYGHDAEKISTAVKMTASGDVYTAAIPTNRENYVYYYIEVKTADGTVTKPYDKSAPIALFVDDGRILGDPSQITLVPDTKQGGLRFSWVTVPAVKDTVIQYKVKDAAAWQTAKGTSYVDAVTPGWKELATHQVTLTGLTPDATYVYKVGDGANFMSEEQTFKAPAKPDADSFSFLFISDPQSVSVEDYDSFKKSLDYATEVVKPEFIVSGGDTTQDGYKATEWEACFEVMGDYYATYPTITVPGNHEMKGDWGFTAFAQRFNMPGGKSGTAFDNTIGAFEYGDACIIAINTEVTPPADKASILEKQLKWAKSAFEASGKKWRIMVTHAGPYTSNHDPLEVRDYFINDSAYSIDALDVDLFLNGHDHIYIRSTVKDDVKVNTGDGTTYVTGGTVGNKYYAYIPERSDYSTDFYTDKEDQQVFTVFTVSEDQITGTAYQCQDDDVDAKAELESWDNWKAIDTYEIRNNQQTGKTVTDYSDLKKSDSYYDAAAYVINKGLISGKASYVFGGNDTMTRGEIASVLYNLAGRPACKVTTKYSDVDARSSYKLAISWVTEKGIMGGTATDKFSPGGLLNRQTFATVLTRYAKLAGKDVSADDAALRAFTDYNDISTWARDGVNYCLKAGIIKGNQSGAFVPSGTITRAQLAVMIHRFAV